MTNEQHYQDANLRATQCTRVYQYLEKHGTLTCWEAWNKLGVASLTSRISQLNKREGITIKKRWVNTVNQFNEPTKYAEYFIV